MTDNQTERQTAGGTDRQADWQADRMTYKQTERQHEDRQRVKQIGEWTGSHSQFKTIMSSFHLKMTEYPWALELFNF
jgi:hypothetical protein